MNINLAWRNIDISVKDTKIVSNSSGYCESGRILAIMGASGSGKTTLLSMLAAQKIKKVQIKGEVSI